MLNEVTETSYYTVEFRSSSDRDLWLFASNDKQNRELTADEAREFVQLCQDLDLAGVRVHLHTQRVSKQLVMEKLA